jgi:predicted AAA+ superfamily ATPase
MIPRHLLPELARCAGEYPIVTLTGPRQSGKTTLAQTAFPDLPYVNFERPDQRALFAEDPQGFLAGFAQGAVFDEIQWVPEICSWLQDLVDRDPTPGRFVLTGSQNFSLTNQVTQSLAGRTAVLELLPFAIGELETGNHLADDLDTVLWTGGYPPLHDRGLRPDRWQADYLATYLERDLRQLAAIQDLSLFQRFLKLAAGCVGQLFVASRLAGDVGVDQKTIERWVSLLEASYVATRVQPFHTNLRKRMTRSPKFYFLDTGLVCHLLGIHTPEQLAPHPLRGAIFENWVASELLKETTNRGRRADLAFWRTYDGQEVDFLREDGDVIELIECKAGQTVHPRALGPLKRVGRLFEGRQVRRQLIHGGDEEMELSGVRIVPWRRIAKR